jgi:hypothetical protein
MSPDPYDTRDAQEHAEIAAILAQLPDAHPAREAYGRGAGTIELTHLVADRAELVEGLKAAYLAGRWRVLKRTAGFRP